MVRWLVRSRVFLFSGALGWILPSKPVSDESVEPPRERHSSLIECAREMVPPPHSLCFIMHYAWTR